MDQERERQRIVTWSDPLVAAQKAQQMSGLDFLRAIVSGELPRPPIGILIRMKLHEVETGSVVFLLEPDESLYNPIGSVHGGVIATACDSAASCAVQTHLLPGQAYTTLELKVNYIRPITMKTGILRCVGHSIHVGRRTGTAEARLEDADGRLYAHAIVTCMIFQLAGASRE